MFGVVVHIISSLLSRPVKLMEKTSSDPDKDLGRLQSEIIWHLSCNLKIILFSSGEEPLPILLLLNPNRIEPNSPEMNRIMASR